MPALTGAGCRVVTYDRRGFGDSDAIVPVEVSGSRTADSVSDSELVVVEGAPHGFNVSHSDEFNRHLLAFLEK